jgi:DNA (cytosine-5)-methyltransferase 1
MRMIDMFAGLGGFTEGAVMAGQRVVWAGNHWGPAVHYHSRNHPGTPMVCQDLHQANWLQVPRHEGVLASPACQGHTPARGKEQAHHDAQRATAWAVVSAVECHRPQIVIVENVPGFLQWVLYPAWKAALEALGYALGVHVLDAADFGVPQNRVRVFIVATRSKRPLRLSFEKLPPVAFGSVVDLDSGTWSRVRKPGRSVKTLKRILQGRRDCGRDFVIPYYGSGSGLTGRSLQRPIGTITTRARWAIVRGNEMRMLTVGETRAAMGFRADYALPENVALATHLLGNGVPPPMSAAVIREVVRKV